MKKTKTNLIKHLWHAKLIHETTDEIKRRFAHNQQEFEQIDIISINADLRAIAAAQKLIAELESQPLHKEPKP